MSVETNQAVSEEVNLLPPALLSRNPLAWLTIFGPGAVIASLTIGAGELIFSSRGGAIFGYRLLWFFALILLSKWVLVFVTARHIVLTGAHPFQRWMDFPGPRGWLPIALFFLAVISFPIWVCFHAGTVGTLLSWLAGTERSVHGAAHYLWGMGILAVVLVLVFTGGYQRLERLQLVIVILMLLCVVVSALLLKPDWVEFLKGLFIPRALEYPAWVASQEEFARRPVWVETITYVGVLGGSGYDYLAYVSYLRDKHWGQAGKAVATRAEMESMANNPAHLNRRWLRAVWIDCTLSFVAVLIFSAVFVACGAMILGPAHKIPSGSNLLTLQAEFVTPVFPWLKHVYFVGAFLTIFGTLYGTIEVAPAVLREIAYAMDPKAAATRAGQLRRWSVLWVGLGGFAILIGSFLYSLRSGAANPPGLIALLTPANLFTGVLACGFICLLSLWVECRFVPRGLRMNWLLTALNAIAGVIFLLLGFKAYWDHSQWNALLLLASTIALGWIAASLRQRTEQGKSKSVGPQSLRDPRRYIASDLLTVKTSSTVTTDAKIHDIAVGYIRKQVGDRTDRPFASLGMLHPSLVHRLSLADGELVVVSVFFSNESWYAFTTRRIVSQFQGVFQSLDPSRGIEDDFPNFKGHDPADDSDLKRVGVIPRDVATITAKDSGAVVRFEYQTGEGSTFPMYAARYWNIKHPFLHKFMTTAEHEIYKANNPTRRTTSPWRRPVPPAKDQAQLIVKFHARGVISIEEVWSQLRSRATSETLPNFMAEFPPEIHDYLRCVVLTNPEEYQTQQDKALFKALARWYDSYDRNNG